MLADAAAYLDHAEASRCAFAPKTESICRKLGLQNRKAGRGGENEQLIHNEAERVFRLVVVVVVTLILALALALALALTVCRLCDVSSDGKLDLDELAKMTGFSKMAKNLLGKADVDRSGQVHPHPNPNPNPTLTLP
jgi:hypothetical protein